MFFGVTRSVCVYSIAERSSLAFWQTDKVLFPFSNVKAEKLQRGLVNSKIINSISLPKLQEFCNENAATWRPSLLQSRYSYIIKRLVKTLNQPMTATQIRTARNLKIYHRNWTDFCKGRGRIVQQGSRVACCSRLSRLKSAGEKLTRKEKEGWLNRRSKCFRAVSEQRTTNESKKPRENTPGSACYAGWGWLRGILRGD